MYNRFVNSPFLFSFRSCLCKLAVAPSSSAAAAPPDAMVTNSTSPCYRSQVTSANGGGSTAWDVLTWQPGNPPKFQ